MTREFDLDRAIRKVPDFPHKGILYYDITSVLINPEAFSWCVNQMVALYGEGRIDGVAGVESRGFIFAAPLAQILGIPLILVRKAGKLPGATLKKSYQLEYGEAEVEIHQADVPVGKRVLLVDDLLATGGTIAAAAQLLIQGGAIVEEAFGIVGLPFLGFRDGLSGMKVKTLIDYNPQ